MYREIWYHSWKKMESFQEDNLMVHRVYYGCAHLLIRQIRHNKIRRYVQIINTLLATRAYLIRRKHRLIKRDFYRLHIWRQAAVCKNPREIAWGLEIVKNNGSLLSHDGISAFLYRAMHVYVHIYTSDKRRLRDTLGDLYP